MSIKEGDTVTVHYTGTLDDGTMFDSSEGKEPLTFTIGQHQVIRGFEEGVEGMERGEEKMLDIPAKEAYGDKRKELIQKVPKTIFKDFVPEKGQQIGLMSKDGKQLMAAVLALEENTVILDLNHPLAGKNLHFKVKIERIT